MTKYKVVRFWKIEAKSIVEALEKSRKEEHGQVIIEKLKSCEN